MELSINVNDKKVYETLVQFLNAMGITVSGKHNFENKTSNPKYKYPLSGTVMRYDDPFGPATNNSDWEAAK